MNFTHISRILVNSFIRSFLNSFTSGDINVIPWGSRSLFAGGINVVSLLLRSSDGADLMRVRPSYHAGVLYIGLGGSGRGIPGRLGPRRGGLRGLLGLGDSLALRSFGIVFCIALAMYLNIRGNTTPLFALAIFQAILGLNNMSLVRAIPGRSQDGTHCRHCPSEKETLGHVLGSCPHGELLRNTRHHRVRSLIAKALREKHYSVFEEVHGVSDDAMHLVCRNGNSPQFLYLVWSGLFISTTSSAEARVVEAAEQQTSRAAWCGRTMDGLDPERKQRGRQPGTGPAAVSLLHDRRDDRSPSWTRVSAVTAGTRLGSQRLSKDHGLKPWLSRHDLWPVNGPGADRLGTTPPLPRLRSGGPQPNRTRVSAATAGTMQGSQRLSKDRATGYLGTTCDLHRTRC
ncbi:hypothetical protein C0J52_19473 [Blattella germanica]|nr:hypothetical protein C0J52_19473 [Blattella germanica]